MLVRKTEVQNYSPGIPVTGPSNLVTAFNYQHGATRGITHDQSLPIEVAEQDAGHNQAV